MIDPSDQMKELEFRTGKRMVPTYLAVLMEGLPTHRMTFTEAVQHANKRMMRDHVNAQQDKILAAHFRELR